MGRDPYLHMLCGTGPRGPRAFNREHSIVTSLPGCPFTGRPVLCFQTPRFMFGSRGTTGLCCASVGKQSFSGSMRRAGWTCCFTLAGGGAASASTSSSFPPVSPLPLGMWYASFWFRMPVCSSRWPLGCTVFAWPPVLLPSCPPPAASRIVCGLLRSTYGCFSVAT